MWVVAGLTLASGLQVALRHAGDPSTMNSPRRILEHIGRTPLVAIAMTRRGAAGPGARQVRAYESGRQLKDRIALAIVADAEARGLLAPGATLIEATAGNTGVGLALVAAARGYSLVCVMPEKMSVDKRIALATLGARVIVTPNAPHRSADNFRNVARRLAEERTGGS
jgi:cysteine synthase